MLFLLRSHVVVGCTAKPQSEDNVSLNASCFIKSVLYVTDGRKKSLICKRGSKYFKAHGGYSHYSLNVLLLIYQKCCRFRLCGNRQTVAQTRCRRHSYFRKKELFFMMPFLPSIDVGHLSAVNRSWWSVCAFTFYF